MNQSIDRSVGPDYDTHSGIEMDETRFGFGSPDSLCHFIEFKTHLLYGTYLKWMRPNELLKRFSEHTHIFHTAHQLSHALSQVVALLFRSNILSFFDLFCFHSLQSKVFFIILVPVCFLFHAQNKRLIFNCSNINKFSSEINK